jgi:hypothetical protein
VYSPRVFLLIYVVYSVAWLLYLKSSPQIATPMEGSDSSSKWVLVSSALALAALGALWLPGKGYVLVHAKDSESLNIEMWRTTAKYACPVYKVTIQGNGTVDYVANISFETVAPNRSSSAKTKFILCSWISTRQISSTSKIGPLRGVSTLPELG